MTRYKDPSFKDLEKIWYEILKEDGFKDIEDTTRATRLLKQWDINFFRNDFQKIKYEAQKDYYHQAQSILMTHSFKNPIYKRIWELHSEGKSERNIADEIGTYKKSMVHRIITEIKEAALKMNGIDTDVQIILRDYDPLMDNNYIYSTWTKYAWYSPKIPHPKTISKHEFFQKKIKEIKDILAHSLVRIACIKGDPYVIYGYIVFDTRKDKQKIEWLCVKKDYLEEGIKELLIESVTGKKF